MDEKTTRSTNPDVERFDRWSATYDRLVMQMLFFGPIQSKMLDLLAQAEAVNVPSCILDVGCGTGRLLRNASVRWPGTTVCGIDPAEGMIANARRLNPGVVFRLAAAEALPFLDQSVDIILSSMSFHHWTDQVKGLQEIARVLRPGGWFCLADHTFQLAGLLGEKARSRNQIRGLIAGAGLTLREQRSAWTRFVLITLVEILGSLSCLG